MKETIPVVEGESQDQEDQNHDQWDVKDDDGERQQVRRRRILEYHAHTLADKVPLNAALGSINAGLMQMVIAFDQAINENLAASPMTVERIMPLAAAIELHLKLTRQIDRFAQLEFRSADKSAEEREDHTKILR